MALTTSMHHGLMLVAYNTCSLVVVHINIYIYIDRILLYFLILRGIEEKEHILLHKVHFMIKL